MYPEAVDVAAAISAGASAPEIDATSSGSCTGASSVLEKNEATRHARAEPAGGSIDTASIIAKSPSRLLSGGTTALRANSSSAYGKGGREEDGCDEQERDGVVAGAAGDAGEEDDGLDTIQASSSSVSLTGKKKRKKKKLGICLSHCKYDSVRRCSTALGMKEMSEGEDWTLLWMDWAPTMDRVGDMKMYQKVNHFPGMQEICRKDMLAKNMNRLSKMFPKDYNIFPPSWCMPQDYGDFQAFCRTKKNKTFIKKPDAGCQGKGIVVTRNPKDISTKDNCVVQQYLSKPFLIDGFKFDYRIYVLITSCDPLRVFVYKDGLARFCTVKYTDPTQNNVDSVCMHLTNYAINKHSTNFVRDDDSGSKRRITTVDKWFENNGYDIKKIWGDIEDVIIKTLISCHPIIKHNYRSCFPSLGMRHSACFEVLGFDVMLDRKLKPWIIEVNLSPSFHTDAPLDKEVKEGLLNDALQLINLHGIDKKKVLEDERRRMRERLLSRGKPKSGFSVDAQTRAEDEAYLEKFEDAHLGGYRRIYPQNNKEKYEHFFENCGSLFGETAAYRARQECARAQREEIEAKLQEKQRWKDKLQHRSTTVAANLGGAGVRRSDTSAGGRHGVNSLPRPESPQGPRRFRQSYSAGDRDNHIMATAAQHGQQTSGSLGQRAAVEMKTVPFPASAPGTVHPDHEAWPIDEAAEKERLDLLKKRGEMLTDLRIDEYVYCLLAAVGNPIGLDTSLAIPTNAVRTDAVVLDANSHSMLLPMQRRGITAGNTVPLPATVTGRQQQTTASRGITPRRTSKPPVHHQQPALRQSPMSSSLSGGDARHPKQSPAHRHHQAHTNNALITADPTAMLAADVRRPIATTTQQQRHAPTSRRALSFSQEAQQQHRGIQGAEREQNTAVRANATASFESRYSSLAGDVASNGNDGNARLRNSLPEPSPSIHFQPQGTASSSVASGGLMVQHSLPTTLTSSSGALATTLPLTHHHQSSIPTTASQHILAHASSVTSTFLPQNLTISGLGIAAEQRNGNGTGSSGSTASRSQNPRTGGLLQRPTAMAPPAASAFADPYDGSQRHLTGMSADRSSAAARASHLSSSSRGNVHHLQSISSS
eukprot:scpid16248/ scgid30201/ Tubulin polyglutamylase ttll6; Tubulin tyrosine ligase-like family member 6